MLDSIVAFSVEMFLDGGAFIGEKISEYCLSVALQILFLRPLVFAVGLFVAFENGDMCWCSVKREKNSRKTSRDRIV